MNDLTRLAHAGDPETSHLAAAQLDPEGRVSLKQAIVALLDERPRTGDELIAAYATQAEIHLWPLVADLHSVKRRLSELHKLHHVVRESGETRLSRLGRKSTVWELAVPAEEARLVVAMGVVV